MSSQPFAFPREFFFPPFFTRQTNLTTHHAQLVKWSSLILAYCRHHRIYKLSLSPSSSSSPPPTADTTSSSSQPQPVPQPGADELFHNRRIDKRLSTADIREVIDFLRKDGRAEYVGATPGDVVWIYWRSPEEWASLIEDWVDVTGQKGTVLTLYELVEGDATRGAGGSSLSLPPRKTHTYTNIFCCRDTNVVRIPRPGPGPAAEGARHPGQEGQGPDLWAGGLAGRQVLLIPSLTALHHTGEGGHYSTGDTFDIVFYSMLPWYIHGTRTTPACPRSISTEMSQPEHNGPEHNGLDCPSLGNKTKT